MGSYGIRFVEKIRLHNMRARWYNDFKRRFFSIDPINEGLNHYSYTSNPMIYIDFSGMTELKSNKLQLHHFYLEYDWVMSSWFQKQNFFNFGVNDKLSGKVNAEFHRHKLSEQNLVKTVFETLEQDVIFHIYTHANLITLPGDKHQAYMLRLFTDNHNEFIRYGMLDKIAIIKEFFQKDKPCPNFLWIVVNSCSSTSAVPGNIRAEMLWKTIKNSRSIIYTGWNNEAPRYHVLPNMIVNVVNENQAIEEQFKSVNVEAFNGIIYPSKVEHIGASKKTRNGERRVTGEWFKRKIPVN